MHYLQRIILWLKHRKAIATYLIIYKSYIGGKPGGKQQQQQQKDTNNMTFDFAYTLHYQTSTPMPHDVLTVVLKKASHFLIQSSKKFFRKGNFSMI